MKATATATNGLTMQLHGTKSEIIESGKSIALSNSCSVTIMYDNGDSNYINYESSPDGNGCRIWEITVE